MTSDDLLPELLGLPEAERARLARELIASLDGEGEQGAAEAWVRELERRAREVAAGTAGLEDWETLRERILTRLRTR